MASTATASTPSAAEAPSRSSSGAAHSSSLKRAWESFRWEGHEPEDYRGGWGRYRYLYSPWREEVAQGKSPAVVAEAKLCHREGLHPEDYQGTEFLHPYFTVPLALLFAIPGLLLASLGAPAPWAVAVLLGGPVLAVVLLGAVQWGLHSRRQKLVAGATALLQELGTSCAVTRDTPNFYHALSTFYKSEGAVREERRSLLLRAARVRQDSCKSTLPREAVALLEARVAELLKADRALWGEAERTKLELSEESRAVLLELTYRDDDPLIF